MVPVQSYFQFFAIPDLDRPFGRVPTEGCGEAAAKWNRKKNGREALALLALLKCLFARSVR
jgi:hypothetical protein